MRKPGWYIVQVSTGQEPKMVDAIRKACEGIQGRHGPLLQECFSPLFVHRLKLRGQWVDIEKPLLPGYIITITDDPVELFHRLRTVKAFTRMLTQTGDLIPLREDELAWLAAATKPDDRTVPISIAYREGDSLVVTKGPLQGHEAMVKRVIRKKCLAVLEIHVGTVRVTTTVGLSVMPKEEALKEQEQLPAWAQE